MNHPTICVAELCVINFRIFVNSPVLNTKSTTVTRRKNHTKHKIEKYTHKHEIESYLIRSNENIEILNSCFTCRGQQQINVLKILP